MKMGRELYIHVWTAKASHKVQWVTTYFNRHQGTANRDGNPNEGFTQTYGAFMVLMVSQSKTDIRADSNRFILHFK